MKVFVWNYYIGSLTDNCHSGGGLVVFAEDEARAKALAHSASSLPLTKALLLQLRRFQV